MSDDAGRADRRARLWVAGVIALGVVVRLFVVRAQGFPTDVGTFQAWAERLASLGPGRFYEPGYFSDYPPAFLYVLWALGALLDGEPLRLAVKAISIPADVAIAFLGAWVLWRTGARAAGVAAAAIWSLQPGPIFAGPYWGQVDAVGTVPVLGSLLAAGARRWWLAGALGAIAVLIKPQFGIALLVIVVAAAVEFIREGRWRPPVQALGAAMLTSYALCVPFWGLSPLRIANELSTLVRSAAETYPYSSLYAFNLWSILYDFWKPDDGVVVYGALLLGAGLIAAVVPLWWRRDTGMLLTCAALAAMAFYFLPTRAHERYLFPAFALLLPFAASRRRAFIPYATLAVAFAVSLYFAFTRYEQYVDLRVPALVEATLFSRGGQIGVALVMMGAAAYLAWRLLRSDGVLVPDATWAIGRVTVPRTGFRLPTGLGPGGVPRRRDVVIALLVALAVLASRGYRLDWPRDMYFDEVYHARTAFELLAQRDPYEWTHPHLAKEIMALGILAFSDDRVVAHEPTSSLTSLFTVASDGTRIVANSGGFIFIRARSGADVPLTQTPGPPRAMAAADGRLFIATDHGVCVVTIPPEPAGGNRPFDRCATSPFDPSPVVGLSVAAGRVFLATGQGVADWADLAGPPVVYAGEVTAITAKPDGTELYALDSAGIVHVVAGDTAAETRALTGGRPGQAIAYALGPNRVFVARSDSPILDVFELESGAHEAVPLSNGRTGSFTTGATALAVVPRTDFLYALDEGKLIVVETHGSSPYVAIPVGGTLLGVDGEGDKVLVAGPSGIDEIESGRHALAWRLPGVLFAAFLAFVLVLLARRLFGSTVVPVVVGLAVMLDGSMYAQARIGMNDIYVATCIVAGWYFVVAAHRPRRSAAFDILVAGVLFGLAAAAKWAAFYALAGLFVAAVAISLRAYERGRPGNGGPLDLLGGRGRNAALLFAAFVITPIAIYLASYARWFGGPTIPYGWNIVELTQQMYWYHSSLTAPHPAGSPWWSWPFVLKPVYWYFGQSAGGDNAYIYDTGNVVLFWGGIAAFIWCGIAAVRAKSIALGFVVYAGLTQYVAWIPISRVLFFYHFFTALPFYLLGLAAGLAYLWETGRVRPVVVYLAAAAAAFGYFYPFISAQPFPGAQAGMFFILPTWTYDCQFYPTFVCNPTLGGSFSAAALFGRLAISLALAAGIALLLFAAMRSPAAARLLATVRPEARR